MQEQSISSQRQYTVQTHFKSGPVIILLTGHQKKKKVLHEVEVVAMGRGCVGKGVGINTVGVEATCSCNLFVHSRPTNSI